MKYLIITLFCLGILNPKLTFAQCGASNNIGGTIYLDANMNGLSDETTSTGMRNISVSAYDASNNVLATTTSDINGDYVLAIANGKTVRLEFTNLPSGFYPSAKGTNNNSIVQFVSSPTCTADLGLTNGAVYCEDLPKVAMPCFVNGDPLAGGTGGTLDAYIAFDYNVSGTSPTVEHVAPASEVGAVLGATWDRRTETMFTTAFLKRHSGFGPLGIGGIYTIGGLNTTTYNVSNYFDLSPCTNLGTVARTDLPASATESNYDEDAYLNIGKKGLGGLSLSEDGTALFTINLNTKELLKIDIRSNPTAAINTSITCADVTTYAVPNPTCPNSDYRPFAVTAYNEKIYVGVICSAETSGLESELSATIYEFDPMATTFSSFFNFSLEDGIDLDKGCVTFEKGCGWMPWVNTYPIDIQGFSGELIQPQPLLMDIDFDANGSMILGFGDRFGHQTGYENYFVPGSTALYHGNSGGDIYFVYNDNGTYVLEQNGNIIDNNGNVIQSGCGTNPSNGVEFFCGEDWENTHKETALGPLTLHHGQGDVLVTSFDPINAFSGGALWLSLMNGSDNNAVQLYGGGTENFGKAAGFGDVELLCGTAPIEIGNYVWIDQNKNGRQDADEAAISGVTVNLYDAVGTLIGTEMTDTNGQYYFNSTEHTNMDIFTTYYVVIDNYDPATGGLNGNGQFITINSGDGDFLGNDINGNDGITGGGPGFIGDRPYVEVITGNYGENNHNIDFGFSTCLSATITYGECEFNETGVQTIIGIEIAWDNLTAGDVLQVTTTSGQLQSHTVAATGAGIKTVYFTVPTDGSENPISIVNNNDANCSASITYAVDNRLDITAITPGVCNYNTNALTSTSDLMVDFSWNNLIIGTPIIIEINGANILYTTTTVSGTANVMTTITADGSSNNLVRAYVDNNIYSCAKDTATYTATAACPACGIRISNVELGACEYDAVGLTSSHDVIVEVTWANTDLVGSLPQDINITVAGAASVRTLSATTVHGTDTLHFSVPADNGMNKAITAAFANDGACSANTTYDAREACPVRYDLALNKSIDTNTANISDNVVFTIEVVNEGEADATNVVVEDVLPANVTYNNIFTVSTGSFDGTDWTIGTVSVGATESMTITMTASQSGVFFNDAQIRSMSETDTDSTPDNDKIGEDDMDDACFSVPFDYCTGDVITATATNAYYNYQWYKDNVAINGATNQIYQITEVGQFYYTATTAESGGENIEFCCPIIVQAGTCGCEASVVSTTIADCVDASASTTALRAVVDWQNMADGDVLEVSADGVTQNIAISNSNLHGIDTLLFTVATGAGAGQSVSLNVLGSTGCNLTNGTYTSPSACIACALMVSNITTGSCSYNGGDGVSEFPLSYTVGWTDLMLGDFIVAQASGQIDTIMPSTTSGSQVINTTARATGTTDNIIYVATAPTSNCATTANYTAPAPCPPCNLDIAYINVGACENGLNQQDIQVGVKWQYVTTNDVLSIDIGGTIQTLNITETSGAGVLTFDNLVSDGATHNVSASFGNVANTCTATASYTAQAACPACDLQVTNISVGDCVYDSNNALSEATVSVSVSWANALSGDIINVVAQDSARTSYPIGMMTTGTTTIDVTTLATDNTDFLQVYFGANYDDCVVPLQPFNAPAPCNCPPKICLPITVTKKID